MRSEFETKNIDATLAIAGAESAKKLLMQTGN